MTDIEKRFKAIQEVQGDIEDLKAIKRIGEDADASEGISLAEMDRIRNEQALLKIAK